MSAFTRRDFVIGAGLLLSCSRLSAKAKAADELSLIKRLKIQDSDYTASPSYFMAPTQGYENLAQDPQFGLDKLVKSLCLTEHNHDTGEVLLNEERKHAVLLRRGTAIYLGADILAICTHEVELGRPSFIYFASSSSNIAQTEIDILPFTMGVKTDIAFVRAKDISQLVKIGLKPVKWGSLFDALQSPSPIVTVGFHGEHLHASIGYGTSYKREIATSTDSGEQLLGKLFCKMGLTNIIRPGQSGGIAACQGKFVGIISQGLFNRKEPQLSEGGVITPAEAVAVAFTTYLPREAKLSGLEVRPEFLRFYKRTYPECMPG